MLKTTHELQPVVDQQSSTHQQQSTTSALFRPSRSRIRTSRCGMKRKNRRTWTSTFFCLSDRDAKSVPLVAERRVLLEAGVGPKRIQLYADDSSEDVREKLESCIGFEKLKSGGGFELLSCQSNCRKLSLISCSWDVQNLKMALGSQSKIYIRPIQNNLDTTSDSKSELGQCEEQEKCNLCLIYMNMNELREHIKVCSSNTSVTVSESEIESNNNSDDLPELVYAERTSREVEEVTDKDSNSNDDKSNGSATIPVYELTENSYPRTPNESIIEVGEVAPVIVSNEVGVSSINETITIQELAQRCVKFCVDIEVSNPTDILRYLQSKIVTGRKLELEDEVSTIEGETNYIMIDRNNLLTTAFEEISGLDNLRLTLEVQFYDESAIDFGGPRKEFFTLILHDIYSQYFDPVREFSQDYEVIGKILAPSLLQNGKLPRMLSPNLMEEVFQSQTPREFVRDLRRGLDALGVFQIISKLPALMHFFTAGNSGNLTFKMLTNLLKPEFSPEGSNRRRNESIVYSKFIKYLREAGSGRRPCNLRNVLRFATSAEEEPCLGFGIPPSLHFVESHSFLPTANTCINRMTLTIPSDGIEIPPDDVLYNLFDFGFCNEYYGKN